MATETTSAGITRISCDLIFASKDIDMNFWPLIQYIANDDTPKLSIFNPRPVTISSNLKTTTNKKKKNAVEVPTTLPMTNPIRNELVIANPKINPAAVFRKIDSTARQKMPTRIAAIDAITSKANMIPHSNVIAKKVKFMLLIFALEDKQTRKLIAQLNKFHMEALLSESQSPKYAIMRRKGWRKKSHSS